MKQKLTSPLSSQPDNLLTASLTAGVLWRSNQKDFSVSPENIGHLEERLEKALITSREEKEMIIFWKEPSFLFKTQNKNAFDLETLGEIWQRVAQKIPGPYRLEMHFQNPENLSWYADKFGNTDLQIHSHYTYIKPDSSMLDWRWPLRLGFLDQAIGKKISHWEASCPLLDKVCDVVDPFIYGNKVDVLVSSCFIETLSRLREIPLPIQANCLLFIGATDSDAQLYAKTAPELQKLTGAKAIIISSISIEAAEPWLQNLLDQLSKDKNLDQVLMTNELTDPDVRNYLITSRQFINDIKPSTINANFTKIIQITPELMEEIKHSKPAGGVENLGPKIAGGLGHFGGHFAFGGGPGGGGLGGDASERGFVPLNQPREYMRKENQPVSVPPIPEEFSKPQMAMHTHAKPKTHRVLQGQLYEESKKCILPKDRFIPDKDYLLQIQIASPDPDWMKVKENFPDEKLSTSSKGHKLRVEFVEPNHFAEIYTGFIHYPKSGSSTICSFPFRVNKNYPLFNGHINIYHQNRLLQCAFLRGPVSLEVIPDCKEGIEFGLEITTRSSDLDLNNRTPYQASIILDHDCNNDQYLTISSDEFASLITLSAIKTDREYISGILNQKRDGKKKTLNLNSETTISMLRDLAINGRDAYISAYGGNSEFKKSLDKADHIQVLLKSEDDFFPIDFFYTKQAPMPEANLCPKAEESISKGKMCEQPCQIIQDEEENNICPMAFWGLNRVIEWQTPKFDSDETSNNNEPDTKNNKLHPFSKILFGKSDKIFSSNISEFLKCINEEVKAQAIPVKNWAEWKEQVNAQQPETLILMVHTEQKNGIPTMEMEGNQISSANISKKYVDTNNTLHPLVLLLGCGTHESRVPAFNLVKHFRDANASIVIGTYAELEYYDAPLLAKIIIKTLAEMRTIEHATIGDVMLKIKRQTLLNDSPMALALVAYGDADWRV